jgi:hypothetical protein
MQKKMEKEGRVLRSDAKGNRNRRARTGHSSSHQMHSQILQDESLPTERSLQSKLMLGKYVRDSKIPTVC